MEAFLRPREERETGGEDVPREERLRREAHVADLVGVPWPTPPLPKKKRAGRWKFAEHYHIALQTWIRTTAAAADLEAGIARVPSSSVPQWWRPG